MLKSFSETVTKDDIKKLKYSTIKLDSLICALGFQYLGSAFSFGLTFCDNCTYVILL